MPRPRNADRVDLQPLDQIGWLAGRNERFLEWVRRNGRWVHVPGGHTLFRAGDETDGMYGIASGAVDVEFVGDGMESFLTLRLEPGGWIGQGTLVPGLPRPFNLLVPIESRLLKIPATALRALVASEPQAWSEFYELCIRQILGLLSILNESQVLPPKARLARLLLRLSAANSKVEAAQEGLAALLGISKSSVRRALAELTQVGAIETRYGRVTVLDRSTLSSVAAAP